MGNIWNRIKSHLSGWNIISILIINLCVTSLSYSLLILGYWVPIVLLFLVLNGIGVASVIFFQYKNNLHLRLRERQIVLNQVFDAIHNGPLQTIAGIIIRSHDQKDIPPQLIDKIQEINDSLRSIGDSLIENEINKDDYFYLEPDLKLDKRLPMHEILYEVYTSVLYRDLPHLKTLKVKAINFEPIDSRYLDSSLKQGICRFLEEALINVGKHAIGVTHLNIMTTYAEGHNIIRIIDDGASHESFDSMARAGIGTRHAQLLAKRLKGRFRRFPNLPQGTVCELTWTPKKTWLEKIFGNLI